MVSTSEKFMGPSPALKVFLKVCNGARFHSYDFKFSAWVPAKQSYERFLPHFLCL